MQTYGPSTGEGTHCHTCQGDTLRAHWACPGAPSAHQAVKESQDCMCPETIGTIILTFPYSLPTKTRHRKDSFHQPLLLGFQPPTLQHPRLSLDQARM